MKISDMNKEQLKEYLTTSGEIHRPNQESKAWQRAFELARGEGYGELDMGCTGCWVKVQKYMSK